MTVACVCVHTQTPTQDTKAHKTGLLAGIMASNMAEDVIVDLEDVPTVEEMQPVLSTPSWWDYYVDCVRKEKLVELKWFVRRHDVDLDARLQKVNKSGSQETSEDTSDMSPLHLAVLQQNKAMVRFLLSQGCDVEVKEGKRNMTPLHCAVLYPNRHIFRLLLNAGADIHARTKIGETLLHLAILHATPPWGQKRPVYKIYSEFLSQRCDLNAVNDLGLSPLHYAVIFEESTFIERLLFSGCDVNIRTTKRLRDCAPMNDLLYDMGYIDKGEGREYTHTPIHTHPHTPWGVCICV